MRITNQMLSRTSAKTGIPLQRNTLLDILNKKGTPSAENLSDPLLQKANAKSGKQLKEAAESLSDYIEKLSGDGADSLLSQAEASKDASKLAENIAGMAASYNKTLKYLSSSDSAINRFYAQELKNAAADQAAALKEVGITRKKDGSLSVQKSALEAADMDSLKAAFGPASVFAEKAGYISSRIAENAKTSASILGGYNKRGVDYWNALGQNRYDSRR